MRIPTHCTRPLWVAMIKGEPADSPVVGLPRDFQPRNQAVLMHIANTPIASARMIEHTVTLVTYPTKSTLFELL